MSHFDYLQSVQPDYLEEVLTLRPTGGLSFSSDKKQKVFKSDGGHKETVTLSKNNSVFINLSLQNLNQTNKDIVLSLYHDLYKADGLKKSFVLRHPSDNEDYVCMFTQPLTETMARNLRHSYGSMSLLALGAERNLINTSLWVAGSIPTTDYLENTDGEMVIFGGDSVTFGGDSEVTW